MLLTRLFDEVVQSPQASTVSGLVPAANAVVAISDALQQTANEEISSSIRKAKILDRAFSTNPKPAFLLNHRVYTKLSENEEISWAIRALVAGSPIVSTAQVTAAVKDAWAQAMLYFITASDVPHNARQQALSGLTNAYIASPASIAKIALKGLWTWYQHVEQTNKDSAAFAAKTGTDLLHTAVTAICVSPSSLTTRTDTDNQQILQVQLVQMLVLCRPEILPRCNWIQICLRVGQDPGNLVRTRKTDCLDRIDECLAFSSTVSPIAPAAYSSLADLAFVAPEAITPLLVQRIEKGLPLEVLRQFGPIEIAIARTSEGTAFIDVLNDKVQNRIPDKNSKDYEDLKWEEEVRSQLAKRKGQQKKLSQEDQVKVNSQLSKEAAIRQTVLAFENKARRSIGTILALATGPPTPYELWLLPSLRVLLGAVSIGIGAIVGDAADQAYMACSELVAPRLGTARRSIGIATLRAIGAGTLPDELAQEPLGGKFILLRLLLANTDLFQTQSLGYCTGFASLVNNHHLTISV